MALMYIWQHEEWPRMCWDDSALCELLATVNVLRGKLAGRLSLFGLRELGESVLDSMTMEIVNSAEIEGEVLNHDSVRSSVARHLGLEYSGMPIADHYTDGVVEVMVDATVNHDKAIDNERLFAWHSALFPTGRSGMYKINHCSQDTATRDINDLVTKGILRKSNDGGGRSTNYELQP